MSTSDEYPGFRIVLRGYDPTAVEEVLDDLYSALSDAAEQIEQLNLRESRRGAALDALRAQLEASSERVSALESELRSAALPTYQSLGTHIASLLASAEAEGVEIRARAVGEAELVRQEAKTAAEALQREMEESAAQRQAEMETALRAELARHQATLEKAREDLAGARVLANSIILAAQEEAEQARQQSARWVTDSQAQRTEIRSHISQIRELLNFALTSEADEQPSADQTVTLSLHREVGEEQAASVEKSRAPTAPESVAPPSSLPIPEVQDLAGVAETAACTQRL